MGSKKVSGFWGWVGMGLFIAAWDLSPETETMSHWFYPRGGHGKKSMVAVWIYLTLHLLRLIPDGIDPLRKTDKRKGY